LSTYLYTTTEGLELDCCYEISPYEPANYPEGIPEYPMSVTVYTISINGSDIYDILSNYIITAIEEEILMDLQK